MWLNSGFIDFPIEGQEYPYRYDFNINRPATEQYEILIEAGRKNSNQLYAGSTVYIVHGNHPIYTPIYYYTDNCLLMYNLYVHFLAATNIVNVHIYEPIISGITPRILIYYRRWNW